MATRRSRWVELVDQRADGETILFPFRIRSEVRGPRVRAICFLKTESGWKQYRDWPWQTHGHGKNVSQEELDRVAIKAADAFRDWLVENESQKYNTIIETGTEIVTGWEINPLYDTGESLVPLL